MSYEAPTLDQFVEKFPEFEEETPAAINRALNEAGRGVDKTWLEDDYANAITYLAAHLLSSAQAAIDTVGTEGEISSESFGKISVSYRPRSSQSSAAVTSSLSGTPYGKKFLELRILNHPPVLML